MNVFIILSILVIAIGVIFLLASPSTLFKFNSAGIWAYHSSYPNFPTEAWSEDSNGSLFCESCYSYGAPNCV